MSCSITRLVTSVCRCHPSFIGDPRSKQSFRTIRDPSDRVAFCERAAEMHRLHFIAPSNRPQARDFATVVAAVHPTAAKTPSVSRRTALPEAELDQAALPLNIFAKNSRLYSPAMARLTPLTMVETGLLSFSNCLFRANRRIPPACCRRSTSVPSHPIKENLPGWSFCALQSTSSTPSFRFGCSTSWIGSKGNRTWRSSSVGPAQNVNGRRLAPDVSTSIQRMARILYY
jgi:hypothetical protein